MKSIVPNLRYKLICTVLCFFFLGCGGNEECVKRVGAEGYHETAALISADNFLDRVDTIVIAAGVKTDVSTSVDYPDILMAGPAAAALGGPVLLVTANEIPEGVASEIAFHKPKRIVMIGGTSVISSAVEAELVSLTDGMTEVTRLAGVDRWDTAALLSKQAFRPDVSNVVVVTSSGDELAEVLAAGAAAAALGGPILIVRAKRTNRFPEAVKQELTRLQPRRITIIGSTVGADHEAELEKFTTGPVERWQGENRYDTPAVISKAIFEPGVKNVVIASGESFPDALTAGLAASATRSPLLLVAPDGIQTSASDELTRLSPEEITVVGTVEQVSEDIGCQAGSFHE